MLNFKQLNKTLFAGTLVSSSLLAGPVAASIFSASDVVNQVADAMGGVNQITSLQSQYVDAVINVYVASQADKPGGEPIHFENFEYSITRGLDGQRYNTAWNIQAEYPLHMDYSYTEIINGQHGAILGVHGFAPFPATPMQAMRLGARKVHNLITSPIELVKSMLNEPHNVTLHGSHQSKKKSYTVLSYKEDDSGKEILVWINNSNHLPKKSAYWDSDPSHGDVKIVTSYSNWQTASGFTVPMSIKQRNHDGVVSTTERLTVEFNKILPEDPFAVPPDLTIPLDKKAYQMGQKYSNMIQFSVLSGAPFDLNLYTPETVFLEEVGQGIYHLKSLTHHSLIVEMKDYLILFDPVLFEERTQAALPFIKEKWPTKKIQYVIPTHFHGDHSGGLRGYVADGAKLIASESEATFYKHVLKSKHIIYPDILSLLPRKKRNMGVIGDNEELVFDDGQRRVKLLRIDNRHAPGLIVPYIEDEKLIFVSDLYNPETVSAPMPPEFSLWSLDLYNDLTQRDLDIETIVGAHGGTATYQTFIDHVEGTFFNTP